MRMSCEACRKAEATGKRFICGRRRLMISGAPIFRSFSGFSVTKIFPVLVAPPPPVKAITFGPRDLFDDACQPLDGVVHDRKRGILRALHAAGERACILLRKKALGNFDDHATLSAIVRTRTVEDEPGLSNTQCRLCGTRRGCRRKIPPMNMYRRPCFAALFVAAGRRTSSAWWSGK